MPFEKSEFVFLDDEFLSIVFGYDVEDDSCDDEQQAGDDEHDSANQGGEMKNGMGLPEFNHDRKSEPETHQSDDSSAYADDWTAEGKDTIAPRRSNIHYFKNKLSGAQADGIVSILVGRWMWSWWDTGTGAAETPWW
jgi:hypothetical protein